MPYITTQAVKEIRNQLKSTFPKFKFAVRRDHYSSVKVNVMAGPIDFGTGYEAVNQYWIANNYGDRPEVMNFLQQIKEIVSRNRRELTYDADYGSIPNYYYDIAIGKWDRPYTQKA
jgi:hypothetical protein